MRYGVDGRGSPLVATSFFLLLLLAIGLSTLYWMGSRTRPAGRGLPAKAETERAARAGIFRGRRLLARTTEWSLLLQGKPCNAPFVVGKGRVLCDGNTPLIDQEIFAVAGPRRKGGRVVYSLFLRNDDDEASQQGQRDEDGRVVLLCEARGAGRQQQKTIEVVLSRRGGAAPPTDYAQAGRDAAGSGTLWLP